MQCLLSLSPPPIREIHKIIKLDFDIAKDLISADNYFKMLDGAWSGELEGETNLHKWILKLHVKRKFITFSECLCKKSVFW